MLCRARIYIAAILLLTIALLWAGTLTARGQSVRVSGSVADPEGNALAGTSVQFISQARGDTASALTDESGNYALVVSLAPTAVPGPDGRSPENFRLGQNYPNPFNPGTLIPVQMVRPARVHLSVYNTLGQQVRVLWDSDLAEGIHTFHWDGRDRYGAALPAGVYLCRMIAGTFHRTRKMLLIDGGASGGVPPARPPLRKAIGNEEQLFDVHVSLDGYHSLRQQEVKLSTAVPDVERSFTLYAVGQRLALDPGITYQTIEGFGGFGGVFGTKNRPEFVDLVVNDLGVTILRNRLPASFEPVNDNDDPNDMDLDAFNLTEDFEGYDAPLTEQFDYLMAMKEAGVEKFIATIWSPPGWMKKSGKVPGDDEDAPNPNTTIHTVDPQYFEEVAEFCAAYVKILKRECGIDLYALSVQNEPAFEEPYASCVYSPQGLRDLIKVVGARFEREGLETKFFMPEDTGWHDRVMGYVNAVIDDPEARQYIDITAVHGYDLDGKTGKSYQAKNWRELYEAGAPYGIQLWMTETSGYEDSWDGAIRLASAIHFGLTYGQLSAWVWWSLSVSQGAERYGLIVGLGNRTSRYYASKHYYRYIRPGMVRIESECDDEDVLSVAFVQPGGNLFTVVLINRSTARKTLYITGENLPQKWQLVRSEQYESTRPIGELSPGQRLDLLPRSIVTAFTGTAR